MTKKNFFTCIIILVLSWLLFFAINHVPLPLPGAVSKRWNHDDTVTVCLFAALIVGLVAAYFRPPSKRRGSIPPTHPTKEL